MYDKYGGFKGIKGKKTGWFHLEKIKDRWWLITPEGNSFIILACNHINNLEKVKGHHEYIKKYGDNFIEKDRVGKFITEQLKSWNFNTAGPKPINSMLDKIPYIMGFLSITNNNYWKNDEDFKFEDVFEREYQSNIRQKIKKICLKNKTNPYLVGYTWTDAPRWDIECSRATRGTDWVSSIRRLPGDCEGKKRYVNYLNEKYENDICLFNKVYSLDAISFNHLLSHDFSFIPNKNPKIVNDDKGFLNIISKEINWLVGNTIKKYDPNHLLFGERYILRDHPLEVLNASIEYVDVLTLQVGGGYHGKPWTLDDGIYDELEFNEETFDRLFNLTEKPIYIYDHQCSYPSKDFPNTQWYQCKDLESAVECCEKFMNKALEKPYIIGYGRCQYQSKYVKKVNSLKQGLISLEGFVNNELVNKLTAVNKDLLSKIYKN